MHAGIWWCEFGTVFRNVGAVTLVWWAGIGDVQGARMSKSRTERYLGIANIVCEISLAMWSARRCESGFGVGGCGGCEETAIGEDVSHNYHHEATTCEVARYT